MADGFSVDRRALTETAQGIRASIGALQDLGLDETAEVGRGFSGLSLTGLQAGHADLAGTFGGFCNRWSWGVRSLIQDGDQFAARLGLSAGVYADTEQYLTSVAKHVTVAVAGDPHLSDGQAAQDSWSQDAAAVTGAPTPASGTTWAQVSQQADRQWTEVGRDELKLPAKANRLLNDATGGAG
ncbi:MAG TPA: hypothetical protein VGI00_17900 [Streptosporangiaceae bacterium]|jgi:hypothetical protein